MARKRKKSSYKLPGFVPMPWEMLNSEAYRALPPSAAKCLPYFLGKVKLQYYDPERLRKEFTFSYPEAKRYGYAGSTFSKVIKDLVRFGFIDPADKGGLRGHSKGYNKFTLSMRWRDYGTAHFKELAWETFQPRPNMRVTPKSEPYNSNNGTRKTVPSGLSSDFGVVAA